MMASSMEARFSVKQTDVFEAATLFCTVWKVRFQLLNRLMLIRVAIDEALKCKESW